MISKLHYTRFRGHEGEFSFGPGKNLIKGPNEAGKSTIKEAIAFAWMGTDSASVKNPDHLISVGQDVTEVRVSTPKSTIARKKKRGTTSEVILMREGLPDVKMNQTDLMGQIGISPEVFLSSWIVGYFMQLKADAKLKVLGEVAKIDRKSLLFDLVGPNIAIPSQVKYNNPKIDADAVAGLRRAEQNKRQALEAVQASLLQQLHNMPQETLEIDVPSHNARIAELEAALQEHSLYKQNLPRWKAENDKRSCVKADIAKLELELTELSQSADICEKESGKLTADKQKISEEGQALAKQISDLSSTKKQIEMLVPPKPSVKEGTCPTCLSVVSPDRVSELLKPYEEAVAKYNAHSRQVADFNAEVDQKVSALSKEKEAVRVKFEKVSTELSKRSAALVSLKTQVFGVTQRLESARKTPTELIPPPQAPLGAESELIEALDNAKKQLHEYNLVTTQKARLQGEMQNNSGLIQNYSDLIARYSAVEGALLKLPALETQATLDVIKIPGINMSLVDGELIVMNDEGVDYRCLSDGRRMKADISICMAIKRAEPKSPDWIFIDNADLMDGKFPIPEGLQVLIAHVDPEAAGVEVVCY